MKGGSRLLTKFSKRLSSDSHVLQVIERSDAETVSFDLFDTLVYRTLARPEDLFLLQGQALVEACLFSGTAKEWQRLRKRAEAEFGLAVSPHEVELAQIYEKLVSGGALNGVESAAMAMAKELELEAEVIRPHPEVPSLIASIRKSGRRVVVSTDTYLPEDFIRSTLLNAGIEVDTIVCSSTTGKTKRSGETFLAMRRDFPRTVHFGDNHHADVRNARSAGVPANWLVWQFYDHRSIYAREIEYLQNIGQYRLPASLMATGTTPVEELAIRWAVVLYDYLRDLRRYAVEQNITDIWLLSRDGESLATVLQDHSDFFGTIRARYVRASRKFTHSITARSAPDRYERWTGSKPDADQIELGALAARYYASLLGPESSRVLVVDMTGKGRLQISIGDALPSKICLAGYYFALDFGHEALDHAGQFLPLSYSHFHQAPVEAFAGTTEGTCVGAVDNDGQVAPVMQANPVDVAPEGYVHTLRRVLHELCALDHTALPVDEVVLRQHRKKHIRQLLMHPSHRVAKAMAEWPFIDSYGAQPTYLDRPLVSYSSRLLARKSAVNSWPSLGIYSALPAWGVPFVQAASQARLIMKDWLVKRRQ
jgi:FMN phosphatase YigB (HAD superfamily)